jgi:superfamily I DNA and/or RNA helicase
MANRVNVLLSRAKHGMFLVGNTATLTAKPKDNIWPRVIETLRERGQVGVI